jgi:molybdopterin synthase catalytic subunit
MSAGPVRASLQDGPIDVAALLAWAQGRGDGAVAVFLGTVRDHNAGRRVLFLEYEAYPEMAEAELRRIGEEARGRWPVSRVGVVHRTGRLEIGEASVAIVVASAHRAAAFEACRFVIETLKRTVPIWKRESFEGGAIWIEGPGERGPA